MLKVLNHPLITHKLTQMRKVTTGTKDFREQLDEIAGLMAYEISRDLPLHDVDIITQFLRPKHKNWPKTSSWFRFCGRGWVWWMASVV